MLVAICSKCGRSRDDLAAAEVWSWFAEHACNPTPPPRLQHARAWQKSPCGTWAKYRRGCRCDLCRQACSDYNRRRKARTAVPT